MLIAYQMYKLALHDHIELIKKLKLKSLHGLCKWPKWICKNGGAKNAKQNIHFAWCITFKTVFSLFACLFVNQISDAL